MSDTTDQDLEAEVIEESELYEMSDEELMGMSAPPVNTDTDEDNIEEEDEETSIDEDDDIEPINDDDITQENTNFDINDKTSDNSNNDNQNYELESNQEKDNIDYKAAYEAIFKPFKANGKEIQIRSVDEVISLMQMGANYNKKMAGIKSKLPILKMLEKNDLLNESKLSNAIDLLNGDEAAIANLIKEKNVDIYEIDEDSGTNYIPSNKGISEKELELTQTIDDLRDSENFNRTIDIATKVWDNTSQEFIVENPEILNVLNTHLNQGIYDKIWSEVERLQTLNQLDPKLNSLEAYKIVGDYLNEKGLLGNVAQPKKDGKSEKRQETNSKRKQASRSRGNSSNTNKNNLNKIDPLSLSDEEFAKLGNPSMM